MPRIAKRGPTTPRLLLSHGEAGVSEGGARRSQLVVGVAQRLAAVAVATLVAPTSRLSCVSLGP